MPLTAGLILREQHVSDHGIDAQLEVFDGDIATGRLIAVQIKSGPSYFKSQSHAGVWHRFSNRHKDLWVNHSLPVIIVLCDLDVEMCTFVHVTDERCVSTGNAWKIHVPAANLFGPSTAQTLIDLASPVVPVSEYGIMTEGDFSHGLARRISLDVVVHAAGQGLSRARLGAIVRQALVFGKNSKYANSPISKQVHSGRGVDIVVGLVYLREADRDGAFWVCRFQWISPDYEADPILAFEGVEDGSGLIIDWNGRAELAQFFDCRRLTKSEYLENLDVLLVRIGQAITAMEKMFTSDGANADNLANICRDFEESWDKSSTSPPECDRLDRKVQELLATVGNAGLIWDQRSTRGMVSTRNFIRQYLEQSIRLVQAIGLYREDVN
ncbi:MAG: DUF4365 domain-containing protein [Sulfitobacter sp.]|nr:DUF4365 domain-containing protein [Sulfitobacter sp.]